MRIGPIKALIFDFDGLILNTETASYESWFETYEKRGRLFPIDRWAYRLALSRRDFDPYSHLEELLGHSLAHENVVNERLEIFFGLVETLTIMPGIEDYLSEGKRLRMKLGVASGSEHAWVDNHLSRLALLERFDTIKCLDDVANAKPFPDLYQAVLKELAILPSQAIAFEDSPHGVLAAKRAGIFTVAVPNLVTSQLTFDHADLVLTSLADMSLEELLSRIGDRQNPYGK